MELIPCFLFAQENKAFVLREQKFEYVIKQVKEGTTMSKQGTD